MDKWEYKIIGLSYKGSYKGKENEPALNDLGNEGWELVSVTPYVGIVPPFAYLKRRKS